MEHAALDHYILKNVVTTVDEIPFCNIFQYEEKILYPHILAKVP